MMNYLGYINTDGGPLIIADSNIINDWNGIEGNDYVDLCNVFDYDLTLEGFPINFKSNSPIAWELEGGGTVDIYKNETDDAMLLLNTLNKFINAPQEYELADFMDESGLDELVGDCKEISGILTNYISQM